MLEILVMLLFVLPATALLLSLPSRVSRWKNSFHPLEFINSQGKYQLAAFGLAISLLLLLWVFFPRQLETFLSFGKPSAPTLGMPLFGVNAGDSWLVTGLSFSLFITLATGIFMYMGFQKLMPYKKLLLEYMPWIVAFSVSNAFVEEVIYRVAVVVPLAGKLEPSLIALLSGILFGLPHLRGMPSGLVGAAMSGVLGYILCTSLLETGGLWWAWWIHFLQDVVIFSFLILQAAAPKTK
jgi:uncharacterized protein